jgi:hypothetical protein
MASDNKTAAPRAKRHALDEADARCNLISLRFFLCPVR